MIYSSDVVQCYPGKDGKPRPQAIRNCLPWLDVEIEAIKPNVIVCLGGVAAEQFVATRCGTPFKRLSELFEKEFTCRINGRRTHVYALPHTSGQARAQFPDWDGIYHRTFLLIRRCLDSYWK